MKKDHKKCFNQLFFRNTEQIITELQYLHNYSRNLSGQGYFYPPNQKTSLAQTYIIKSLYFTNVFLRSIEVFCAWLIWLQNSLWKEAFESALQNAKCFPDKIKILCTFTQSCLWYLLVLRCYIQTIVYPSKVSKELWGIIFFEIYWVWT